MSNLRKSISIGLLGLVAGGFVAISAQGQQGSQRGHPSFDDFDLDGSGTVSKEEFYKVRGERMAAMAAEGRQMRGVASAPSFEDLDTDGDGQLSADELAAGQKAHMAQHRGMGKGQGMGYGAGKGKGSGRGCDGVGMNMPTYADFDLNGDGKITEEEFNQSHAARMAERAAEGRQMKNAGDFPGFSGLDTNDDGLISEEELSAHQKEHLNEMLESEIKSE